MGAAEADVVMAAARIARHVAAAMGGRQFFGPRILAPASGDANDLAVGIFPAVPRVVGIRFVFAAVPAVARHVESPIGTRPGGKTAHRFEIVPARSVMSVRVIRRLVAPWILASIGAACRLL